MVIFCLCLWNFSFARLRDQLNNGWRSVSAHGGLKYTFDPGCDQGFGPIRWWALWIPSPLKHTSMYIPSERRWVMSRTQDQTQGWCWVPNLKKSQNKRKPEFWAVKWLRQAVTRSVPWDGLSWWPALLLIDQRLVLCLALLCSPAFLKHKRLLLPCAPLSTLHIALRTAALHCVCLQSIFSNCLWVPLK